MEDELIAQRKKKLQEVQDIGLQGGNLFPNDFKPSYEAAKVLSFYKDYSEEELKNLSEEFSLAGRVMALRDFGKSVFLHIKDRTGVIQG
ncbi:MAG: lysine--tRNA ligase, partial [Thermodesulfobacteriota bacterium]